MAERLGISPSAVSRAISGRGYCKESVRELVLKTAKEMNYAPDHAAKMLKTKKTEKILFAVPDICNPFYFDMINGINSVIEKYGYLLILFYTKHSLTEELRAIQTLRERYADGMIMVSFHFCEKNINAINMLNAPVVLTNKYESPEGGDQFDYVYVDTYAAVKEAAKHLLEQGIRRIAYVGGDMKEQTGFERFCGYRDALTEAGLGIDERYRIESDYTESGGYLAGQRLLALDEPPRAIVAANDLMAIGIMNACVDAGLSIPGDVAVTGIDNLDLSTRVRPKLTSVAMMQEEIGRNAARMLMSRMLGEPLRERAVRIVPRLVVRESSVIGSTHR
ncbi:MAG: LacI family DNA-binding transcriptional regulator [Bacillota bacterium]